MESLVFNDFFSSSRVKYRKADHLFGSPLLITKLTLATIPVNTVGTGLVNLILAFVFSFPNTYKFPAKSLQVFKRVVSVYGFLFPYFLVLPMVLCFLPAAINNHGF